MDKFQVCKCCGSVAAHQDGIFHRCSDGVRLYHYICDSCGLSGPYLEKRSMAYEQFCEKGEVERMRRQQ